MPIALVSALQIMPIDLYSRLTASSGAEDDVDGGYDVFDGACASSVVVFCVLAASVIIWKAVAFFAMAAVLLGVGMSLFAPRSWAGGSGSGARAGTDRAGATKGLTGAAIDDALPASAYEGPAGTGGEDPEPAGSAPVCSVCLEDFQGGETVRRVPACRHLYHARCIDMWLHLHTTCPLCRSDLSPRRRAATSGRIVG